MVKTPDRHSGGREVISAGREAWRANKPISNPTTFLTATDRHDHMIFGREKIVQNWDDCNNADYMIFGQNNLPKL